MSEKDGQLNFSAISGSDDWSPIFGDNFLPKIVGKIMIDPHYALVELVANCWDAGSDVVKITWPLAEGDIFCIEDNGTGMTKPELQRRWRNLSYDRREEQGTTVSFPNKKQKKRIAFGQNGIGKHAMFCFCDEYFIETKKNNKLVQASVKRSSGRNCFDIDVKKELTTKEHGTKIWCTAKKNISLTEKEVLEFISSRFIADPEFKTYVNSELVDFEDLTAFSTEFNVELDNGNIIPIKRFDAEKTGRTSRQSGIAYWVNQKLVGMPSWEGYDGTLLDARYKEAKRYTYVVDASVLTNDSVKQDWSEFRSSSLVNEAKEKVSFAIRDDIQGLTKELRTKKGKEALKANKRGIAKLSIIQKRYIEDFAKDIQLSCPTMTMKDLENMVATLVKLETARTGYSLLEKLSNLESKDLDDLDAILNEWSVTDAKKVLQEVEWRIKLIIQMENLIHSISVDELHQLQPLFDKGLWILGHQYDSLEFTSNRELSTVLRNLFKKTNITRIRNRPDFVVVPKESSLAIHAREDICDDDDEKLRPFQSVVILELKRPGIPIAYEQIDQAKKYAREIKKHVPAKTKISCYVLGSMVDENIGRDDIREGNIHIYPTEYSLVLSQAKRRLFKLRDRISSFEHMSDYFNDTQRDIFEVAG